MPRPIPDALILRATAGEPAAIGELLAAAQSDIRRYARRSCRNASDAEDAVQETLLVLYRRIGALRQVGAISGWLFTIVNRFCLRLAGTLIGAPVDLEAAAFDRRLSHTPPAELRIDLCRAIESLPPQYREVIVLRDLNELTIDEIAAALGASREAVKARLHRARAILREYLIR